MVRGGGGNLIVVDYRTLRENEYLGQWDLPDGRDVTVIIESVTRFVTDAPRRKKIVKDADGKAVFGPDGKPVYKEVPNKAIRISFRGKKKPWLCGPTSQEAIRGMYGRDVDNWIGKFVTLYVDKTVKMGKDTVGGIRVRPTIPKAGSAPTTETLDRPVDREVRDRQDAAFGRQPGEG